MPVEHDAEASSSRAPPPEIRAPQPDAIPESQAIPTSDAIRAAVRKYMYTTTFRLIARGRDESQCLTTLAFGIGFLKNIREQEIEGMRAGGGTPIVDILGLTLLRFGSHQATSLEDGLAQQILAGEVCREQVFILEPRVLMLIGNA